MSLLDILLPQQPPPKRQGRRVSASGVLDERVKAKLKEETDRAYKEKLAEGQRRYYEANKEKLAEGKRRYYEANKEKLAEGQRRYREANKEKLAEGKRRYYEANKEKLAEGQRRYYEANKEKWRTVYAQNRRARLKQGRGPSR
jgi:hypothetical protein